MQRYGIKHGLESMGKPRFATAHYSALSYLNCLPAIYALVDQGTHVVQAPAPGCLFGSRLPATSQEQLPLNGY